MSCSGSNVASEIQGGIGTVLAEGRLYVVLFVSMVVTSAVFIVWNGLQADGPWLGGVLSGLERMSWGIVTSTGLTTTIILAWERFAMVLARRMLNRNREEARREGLQEGLEEGREKGRQEGREEGRRDAALQLLAWLEAQQGLEEAAQAVSAWLGRQKAATEAGEEFEEPMPFGDAKHQP